MKEKMTITKKVLYSVWIVFLLWCLSWFVPCLFNYFL